MVHLAYTRGVANLLPAFPTFLVLSLFLQQYCKHPVPGNKKGPVALSPATKFMDSPVSTISLSVGHCSRIRIYNCFGQKCRQSLQLNPRGTRVLDYSFLSLLSGTQKPAHSSSDPDELQHFKEIFLNFLYFTRRLCALCAHWLLVLPGWAVKHLNNSNNFYVYCLDI